jgi:uncharacterized membrane protein
MERLDALRGFAILWMAFFHFCFDLNLYALIVPHQRFLEDPFWTLQRVGIVSLFLLCAGLGQACAQDAGQSWRSFWRRWGQILGCAVLVSAGSAIMFPRSWISFGVLHGMAAMLLIVRLLLPCLMRMRWCSLAITAAAVVAVALPQVFRRDVFNSRWLDWTGLPSRLPYTQDYVPVLPWLGVMLLGALLGVWLLHRHREWFKGPLPELLRPLALLGRWSLSFYMIHQLVFLGIIIAWVNFTRI